MQLKLFDLTKFMKNLNFFFSVNLLEEYYTGGLGVFSKTKKY